MKKVLLAITLVSACRVQDASVGNQPPDASDAAVAAGKPVFGAPRWALKLDGTLDDSGVRIALDSALNVLTVGEFHGTIDLGSGPMTASTAPGTYVTKRAAGDGGEVWTRAFAPPDPSAIAVRAIAVDSSDRVYIAGDYTGSNVDFGGVVRAGSTSSSAFVAKLDTDGTVLWVSELGGLASGALSVAVSSEGRVYAAGTFLGSISFPNGAAVGHSSGGSGFLAAFDAAGTLLWGHSLVTTTPVQTAQATGVAVGTDGDVTLTGAFEASASFGGEPITAPGYLNAFIARFSPTGDLRWRKVLTATSSTYSIDCVIRGDGIAQVLVQDSDLNVSSQRVYGVDASGEIAANSGPYGVHMHTNAITTTNANDTLLAGNAGYFADFGAGRMPESLFVAAFDETSAYADERSYPVISTSPGGPIGELWDLASRSGVVAFTGYVVGTSDFGTGTQPYIGRQDTVIVFLDAP